MNIIYFLIQQTMFFSIPLLIVALGGMFSERSGVINIALEGIMVMGAFISIGFINVFQDRLSGQGLFLLAFLVAGGRRFILSAPCVCLRQSESRPDDQRYGTEYVCTGLCSFYGENGTRKIPGSFYGYLPY